MHHDPPINKLTQQMNKYILPLIATIGIYSTITTNIPPGAFIFLPERIDTPMTIKTSEHTFSIDSIDGKTYITAQSASQKTITHTLKDPLYQSAERLFTLRSHGCGGESIDLIIQLGPGKAGDIAERNYYRVIFSPSLSSIITEFYDPSISAANAVLPIQTIENLMDARTGKKVKCNGNIPFVESLP